MISDRRRLIRDNALGALLLFVLITLAFAPYAFGDRTLMSSASDAGSIFATGGKPDRDPGYKTFLGLDPGAAAWQTEPEFFLEHHLVADEHVVPLWNPYSGFGQPLAADMLSQPFYPLAWLIDVHPSARAYNWFVILRIYFAALFTFLYLRYFLGWTASIAGAFGFAFTGYLLLYINIAHLSVEAWVPAMVWAMETLIRKRRATDVVVLAFVLAIAVFGGMPESLLLALVFSYIYYALRVVMDPSLRPSWPAALARLIGGSVLGVGLSACLLLPFAEFLKLSTNQHEAAMIGGTIMGLVNDGYQFAYLAPYFVPLIYGPPWSNVLSPDGGWSTVRGFFGVAQSFFAVIAILGSLSIFLRRKVAPWSPVGYFVATAVFIVLKRFGNSLVNWVGALPGLSLEEFAKYDEPILGFCVACLAAFGIERIARRTLDPKLVWIASIALLALMTWFDDWRRADFEALTRHQIWHSGSIAFALLILVSLMLVGWLAVRSRNAEHAWRYAAAGVAVLYIEAVCSFLVPLWYVGNTPRLMSRVAIGGAPYVDFLKSRAARDHLRFFGEDALLVPEWSAAFGVSDVRDLNALYDSHYLKFVRAFLPSGPTTEEFDRFTGVQPLDFTTPLQQRFLELSSIGYVGGNRLIGADESLLNTAVAADTADISPSLRVGAFSAGDAERTGVFMHAPRKRFPIAVTIPSGARLLNFSTGMSASTWSDPTAICGAGARFIVELQDARGNVTKLSDTYIDPKHNIGQRHWFDQSVSIRRWAGQFAQLLFTTQPGPSGSTCADWALWSRVGFDTAQRAKANPFHIAFTSPDALISAYAHPLPRYAIYTSVKQTATDDQALEQLVAARYDPWQTAVVSGASPESAAALAALPAKPSRVTAGRISSYRSQEVEGVVDAPTPALVVLNDTAYPGWHAIVDDREQPVVRANYLFRGVVVPAGHHTVRFVYQPSSFRIGAMLTLLSLALAVITLLVDGIRRARGSQIEAS